MIGIILLSDTLNILAPVVLFRAACFSRPAGLVGVELNAMSLIIMDSFLNSRGRVFYEHSISIVSSIGQTFLLSNIVIRWLDVVNEYRNLINIRLPSSNHIIYVQIVHRYK